MTDGQGIPLSITLSGANDHDRPELWALLDAMQIQKPATRWCQSHLCLDAGYISPETTWEASMYDLIAHTIFRNEGRVGDF
ncbi:MAG: hypothetical protein ACKO34_03850 [Vampirovibrionales bacterium]